MGSTVTTANTVGKTWDGGNEPLGASYGKLMMWFFIRIFSRLWFFKI